MSQCTYERGDALTFLGPRHASASVSCVVLMQSFSSSASMWQNTDLPVAGINPLMQTPAPASSGSTFIPQAAAVQQNRTAQAVLRKTRISPKKLNEFAKLIRRMHIDDALVQCQVAPKKAAKLCYKVTSTSLIRQVTSQYLCGVCRMLSWVDALYFCKMPAYMQQ